MKVIAGYSNINEIRKVLMEKGRVPIVCGKCSKLLMEDAKKILLGDVVYCEEDAFAIKKATPWSLKDKKQLEDFERGLLVCRIAGLRNLYLYAPAPGPN